MRRKRTARAFSLVELVIVVVIIGVIAAIAVPRISRGARGAGESALRGNLASLRNSIDMYAAEHSGKWPGLDGLEATLVDQLTKITNQGGTVGSGAGFVYGPYLRRGFPAIPIGPNAGRANDVLLVNTSPLTDEVDETLTDIGWIYNYATGELIANSDDPDEAGVTFDTY